MISKVEAKAHGVHPQEVVEMVLDEDQHPQTLKKLSESFKKK
jgi:hypothetical protein